MVFKFQRGTDLNLQCYCTWESYIILGVFMIWLLFYLDMGCDLCQIDKGWIMRLFLVGNLTTYEMNYNPEMNGPPVIQFPRLGTGF